jgi:glucose-6-phosphate isomerase
MNNRTTLNSWMALIKHAKDMKQKHMAELFETEDNRFSNFSIEMPCMLLDYSKNLVTADTMEKLFALAKECDVESWRSKMFSGEKINKTEERAVLHTALRNSKKNHIMVDGENITECVELSLVKMKKFTESVRQGKWKGYSGKRITDVVNIGVGGSNLGPQMVTEALKQYSDNSVNVHYVSNVDGTQIANTLKPLNPESVLFIISSKTFTTVETMINAKTAIKWLTTSSFDEKAISKHFIAVTSNTKNAIDVGIDVENVFDLWDWVGGRFSLWSAIGLPIALDLGFDKFIELLEGAEDMDQHFLSTPVQQNAPIILALLSVWNCTFLGAKSQAILPYDQTLHMFSAYMQQAEMESNGKSVSWNGEDINYPTVPSIWGRVRN